MFLHLLISGLTDRNRFFDLAGFPYSGRSTTVKIENRAIFTLLLIICSGFFNFTLAQQTDTALVGQLLREAQISSDSGHYDVAIKKSREIIDREVTPVFEAKARLLLGNVYLEQGAFDPAKEQFQLALRVWEKEEGRASAGSAEALNGLGNLAIRIRDLNGALTYHQEALSIRLNLYGERHEKVANSYNNIANCYFLAGKNEVALSLYKNVLSTRIQLFGMNHPDVASSYNNIGNVFIVLSQPRDALEYFRQALKLRNKLYGKWHPETGKSYQNMGNAFMAIQYPDSTIYYYTRALEVYEKNYSPESPQIADILENLGNAWAEQHNFDKALHLLRRGLDIRKATLEPDNPQIGVDYQRIGGVYQLQGDYIEALGYFQKARNIIEQAFSDQHPRVAEVRDQLGLVNRYLGNYKEAIIHHNYALAVRRVVYGERDPVVAGTHLNLGNCYWAQQNYEKALDHYWENLNILHEVQGENAPKVGAAWMNLGNCYLELGQVDNALKCFEKSKKTIPYEQNLLLSDYYRSIGVVLQKQKLYDQAQEAYEKSLELITFEEQNSLTRLFALNALGQNLLLWAKKSNKITHLKGAEQYFEQAQKVIEELRKKFLNPESRQKISMYHHSVFEGAIETCFLIAGKEGDASYYEKAFLLSEKSKSLLLLESVRTFQQQENQIPDSLVEQLALLSLNIRQSARAEEEALPLRQEREKLLAKIRRRYPGFIERTFGLSAVDVATVRQLVLQPDQGLVSYFAGYQALYGFLITDKKFEAIRVPHELLPLGERVNEFCTSIVAYPFVSRKEAPATDSIYSALAIQLYEHLLLPFESALEGIDNLIVVPDGPLGILPFEALLTTLPAKPQRYRSYPFLIRKYVISYAYSATLLMERAQITRKRPVRSCLAVAPDFEGHSMELSPLPYNKKEAMAVIRLIDGDILAGKEASLENFLDIAASYRILHLATHGKASAENGDNSFLAFKDNLDPVKNDYLYVKDLYQLNLPADMVVLSACETGLGSYLTGEGVISLGRGFAYAGARSLVTTLWSVNDAKTAALMESFYRFLKEGEPKSSALYLAKLQYLDRSTHETAHPFFWACYVPIGEMTPLEIPSPGFLNWRLILLGIALLVTAFFFYRRKSKLE